MRIALVTDAWAPQVNGVVRTLQSTIRTLRAAGNAVEVVAPDRFRSVPCPTYPEIRLALAGSAAVGRRLAAFAPDAIHLATEGPLCLAARRWCLDRALPFTTAFHTRFPDYVARRTGADPEWVWRYIRWFHQPAHAVLAATPTLERELVARGLPQVRPWSRGVDLAQFSPRLAPGQAGEPVLLYVGRLAVEKNVAAFLSGRHPGTRMVVGDGPDRRRLERDFPHARFVGALHGQDLAAAYRAADVLVFPSRTDTFGLVMIEALACGTPVAAYPVGGPADIVTAGVGALDEDLDRAIAAALNCDRAACAARAAQFSWAASTAQFLAALAVRTGRAAA